MKKLVTNEYRDLLSNYLMNGYKADDVGMRDVRYDNKYIEAKLDVTNFFMPSDGKYHFTAFHTQIFVSQLSILHAYLTNNIAEKCGESFMREFKMKFVRVIEKSHDITILLTLKKIKNTTNGIFTYHDFNVENDSFKGYCSGLHTNIKGIS